MDELEIEYFNIHPGSHVGQGIEIGIQKIVEAINQTLRPNQKIMLLLETMSGKGTEIGYQFEQLQQIIENIELKEKVGICMDTCHVFAAGYDIKENLNQVLDQFDKIIGLDKLKAIHLNDSLMPYHSKKDRHAAIGKGEIGLEAILEIMTHPKLKNLPFYLETPLDDIGHKKEIEMLKEAVEKREKEIDF